MCRSSTAHCSTRQFTQHPASRVISANIRSYSLRQPGYENDCRKLQNYCRRNKDRSHREFTQKRRNAIDRCCHHALSASYVYCDTLQHEFLQFSIHKWARRITLDMALRSFNRRFHNSNSGFMVFKIAKTLKHCNN